MNEYEQKSRKCRICLDYEFDRYPDRICTETKVVDIRFGRFYIYDCSICGVYRLDSIAFHQLTDEENGHDENIRAAVSHKFKLVSRAGMLTRIANKEEFYNYFTDAKLPDIEEQITNLIRFVGEECEKPIDFLPELPVDFHSIVGTVNRVSALELLEKLQLEELLSGDEEYKNIQLTLRGWDKYYEDKNHLTEKLVSNY